MIVCLLFSLQEDRGMEKVGAVTAMLIDKVNQVCPDCALIPDRITGGFWRCFTESPQTATYRATVHGTVASSSAALVTAIEGLVASGTPIRVLSVEYSFVSECKVQILAESEGKCQTSEPGSLLVPIVGGALGGVIALTLCVIVVMLALVIRRRRRSKNRRLAGRSTT